MKTLKCFLSATVFFIMSPTLLALEKDKCHKPAPPVSEGFGDRHQITVDSHGSYNSSIVTLSQYDESDKDRIINYSGWGSWYWISPKAGATVRLFDNRAEVYYDFCDFRMPDQYVPDVSLWGDLALLGRQFYLPFWDEEYCKTYACENDATCTEYASNKTSESCEQFAASCLPVKGKYHKCKDHDAKYTSCRKYVDCVNYKYNFDTGIGCGLFNDGCISDKDSRFTINGQ